MLPLQLLATATCQDPSARRAVVETNLALARTGTSSRRDLMDLRRELDQDGSDWMLPLLAGHADPWLRGVAATQSSLRDLPADIVDDVLADSASCFVALQLRPDIAMVPSLLSGLDPRAQDTSVPATALALVERTRTREPLVWAAAFGMVNRFLAVHGLDRSMKAMLRRIEHKVPRRVAYEALLATPGPWQHPLTAAVISGDCGNREVLSTAAGQVIDAGSATDAVLFALLAAPALPEVVKKRVHGVAQAWGGSSACDVFEAGDYSADAVARCEDDLTLGHVATLPAMRSDFEVAFALNLHAESPDRQGRSEGWSAAVQRRVLASGIPAADVAHLIIGGTRIPDEYVTPAVLAHLWHLAGTGALYNSQATERTAALLNDLTLDDVAGFTWSGALAAAAASPAVAQLLGHLLGDLNDVDYLSALATAASGSERATAMDVVASARAAIH